MKSGARLIVEGTVQGVTFRQFVKENADKFELKGFVRNLEDGNLEVVLEGEDDAIAKMVEVVKQGPAHAQIRNVGVEEKQWSGEFSEFKVLRF